MNIRQASLPNRSWFVRCISRSKLLNYCPALHALNRPERKGRGRIAHCFRWDFLSADLTNNAHVPNRRRKCGQNYRDRLLTIAIVITTQWENEIRNIDQVLISQRCTRRASNLMGKTAYDPARRSDRAQGTKVAFPAFWESSFKIQSCSLKTHNTYQICTRRRIKRVDRYIYFYILRAVTTVHDLSERSQNHGHGVAKRVVYGGWKRST